ncbi:BRD4-interacting chromatin-remodeling complex-associated protein isoform X1 [Erpetoichthys calabaricus]|uniref:BRD4-interacting chromatin-remodeling complex-associated protein isoform X1 n=1 Tax=Erpetoichthys calabaricus TaxID=27687 RepID=UPI002234B074|nr:BRD4-interacting chromatin-remodeling complex-associated protein isoform X1 [Erpetoichthys calabaricus]
MDDEDGRCLLDVICDPQALNDFLHGSETQLDNDDLLDGSADPAGAFFVGARAHVQEAQSANHLVSSEPPPVPSTSVDLDFLEDDILGSPTGEGGTSSLANSDQPCDILQQSLAEANITEQSLQEAELDLGPFGLPSLQPVVQTLTDGATTATQIFQGAPDLIGLQPPAVLAQPALVQQQVVNKAISVQPFMPHMGLSNVTLQPISSLQALPNGSPSGALGIGQIQVVGQQVMTINQSGQPIIAKQVQPMGGYHVAQSTGQEGASPQGVTAAGSLVIQNKPGTPATLNGTFGNGTGGPAGAAGVQVTQSLAQSSPIMQAHNVIIQRTPTPIQPKPTSAGVIQSKLYPISPKPFGPNSTGQSNPQSATLTLQNETAQKGQQNVAFMTSKPPQNVVLSTTGTPFPQSLQANIFKQQQAPQQALGKPLSVHLLNNAGSIVIPSQAMIQGQLQGQNPFLLPGQLPPPISALQAGVGGQILTQHSGGHIITNPGGQLIANPILTNQNLAGQLNLGQMLTSQSTPGTAHILSTPIQLQPGQMGPHTLFQMPVSLAGSLHTQTHTTAAGQTVIQGMALPNPVAMLNQAESIGQAINLQQPSVNSTLPAAVPQQADSGLIAGSGVSGSDQQTHHPPAPSILTVQTSSSTQATSHPQQINTVHAPQPPSSQTSPGMVPSPSKIIISQQTPGMLINQESVHMFLQQPEQPQAPLFQQLDKAPPSGGVASHISISSSCVPASVIVSSSSGPSPSGPESLSAEARPGKTASSFGSHTAELVYQIPSASQPQKLVGASPSHTLPHPTSLNESTQQLQQQQPLLISQMQSPHQSRPPSQPQPLSRPPSQPQSRPPSQPQQPLSRPPSEPPLSRSCTPSQLSLQPLFIIQNQIGGSPQPQATQQAPHPMRPPSQPASTPHQSQSPFQQPQLPQAPPLPLTSQSEQHTPPQQQQNLSSPQHLQVHLPSQQTSAVTLPALSAGQFQFQFPVQQTHSSLHPQQTTQPQPQPQPPPPPPAIPVQGTTNIGVKPQHTASQTLHMTAEQQQTLQMVSAQLQSLSTIVQPNAQQKQYREKLHQIQQNIIMQATQQTLSSSQSQSSPNQFSSSQPSILVSQQTIALPSNQSKVQPHPESSPAKVTTQPGAGAPPQLASLLQQTSVVVKTPPTAVSSGATLNEGKVFSAVGPLKQTTQISLPLSSQGVQSKTGVISSLPGLSLGKGPLQIQVLGAGISQIVPTTTVQSQPQAGNTLKRPFSVQPSKEARILEQLRKQQGSVLHPDYQAPFRSFEDALQRLLPYHLYQGTPSSSHDYDKVDEEFESVSTSLLKRTQAMLNKYRLLLFEESRRLGPSAEMVMIDRMFIQEEKTALSQDKVLAKEKPDEFVLHSCPPHNLSTSSSCLPAHRSALLSDTSSSSTSECSKGLGSSTSSTASSSGGSNSSSCAPCITPSLVTPTKLVIKHSGGASPSVSWARATPPPSLTTSVEVDEDTLPSRSKPPIKTYEARRRIALKLKIKQEAGLSKVVHNTALDPTPQPVPPTTQHTSRVPAQPHKQSPLSPVTGSAVCSTETAPTSTVIRAPSNNNVAVTVSCTSAMASGTTTVITTQTSSTTSSSQMNGTLEHPADRKPTPTSCRLPLRKTYRENVSPVRPGPDSKTGGCGFGIGASGDGVEAVSRPHNSSLHQRPSLPHRPLPPSEITRDEEDEDFDSSRTVIASVKLEKKALSVGKGRPKMFEGDRAIPKQQQQDDSGLMKELAEVQEEFYRGIIKQEPPDNYSGGGDSHSTTGSSMTVAGTSSPGDLPWEVSLPTAAKRRKSESLDVDNASFSSDSPPDDILKEHLQCAIDSILNLQQGQGPPAHPTAASGAVGGASSADGESGGGGRIQRSSSTSYRPSHPHRQVGDPYSSQNQNGGLGARTHNR